MHDLIYKHQNNNVIAINRPPRQIRKTVKVVVVLRRIISSEAGSELDLFS